MQYKEFLDRKQDQFESKHEGNMSKSPENKVRQSAGHCAKEEWTDTSVRWGAVLDGLRLSKKMLESRC